MGAKAGEAAAVATAARVGVFKRATSLGDVESLIEHRASIEGPSTPVPADLLRLSIGLEHPDDLIADLEQALAHPAPDGLNPVVTPGPPAAAKVPPADNLAAKIEALLAERIGPLVADRGGSLILEDFSAV